MVTLGKALIRDEGNVKDKLPAITEKQLMSQVKDLAKIYHWKFYHPFLSKWSERGYPDITLIRPPRLLFIELKRDTGKLTESQEEWAKLLKACPGVEYYIFRPSDLETIVGVLNGN